METFFYGIQQAISRRALPAQWTFSVGPKESPTEGALSLGYLADMDAAECQLVFENDRDHDDFVVHLSDPKYYRDNMASLFTQLVRWFRSFHGTEVRDVVRTL